MVGEDRHFTHSTLRERIVEHVFVGDVLRTLWRRGVTDVEILRPEFDAHGYDVVMSRGPIVRHVQLKTQAAGKVSVGRALAEKPSGCVVWIGLNKETLELGPFMWFGAAPGLPLPDISASLPSALKKRTRASWPLTSGFITTIKPSAPAPVWRSRMARANSAMRDGTSTDRATSQSFPIPWYFSKGMSFICIRAGCGHRRVRLLRVSANGRF